MLTNIDIHSILERNTIFNSIKSLLQNFDSSSDVSLKRGIYIYGATGCGKTYFIRSLLQELHYDIIHYDAGDVRNKSLIESISSNNMSSRNVLSMMNKKKNKIAIIMDEIDGMNSGDKGSISALIKIIRQKKTKKQKTENISLNPIICVGNYYMDKKIKELMKVCNVFELFKPTDQQIIQILQQVHYPMISDSVIYYIQGDFRKLDFILRLGPNQTILSSLLTIFPVKSNNDDSKKIVQQLLKQPVNINEHSYFINETDRTTVALLWHENILDVLLSDRQPNKKIFPLYGQILEKICFADYIDRITFQYQIWQFNEMSSLIKTFYCNKKYHEFKKNQLCQTQNWSQEIRFTKVLTKYSTEYNNILFVFHLSNELEMDKKDVVSFFQEIRLHYGAINNTSLLEIEKLINNPTINKLDIKRMYRYLDKNVKRDVLLEDDDDETTE